MLIGITGQIGSGKSSLAALFARWGARVVDADRIGREVVQKNPALLRKLVRVFGADILAKPGALHRERLAAHAFASPVAKRKLDRLVHPYLLRELRHKVHEAARTGRMVVIDAALLLDWHMDKEVDAVVLVHASRKIRTARLASRGISPKDAVARERAQLSYKTYLQRSHYVIFNSGSKADLRAKAYRLWHRLVGKPH